MIMKITGKRLKWYAKKTELDAPVPGKRRRGRQKTRWKDSCKRDMESVVLKEEDVLDRTKRKNDNQNHSDDPR